MAALLGLMAALLGRAFTIGRLGFHIPSYFFFRFHLPSLALRSTLRRRFHEPRPWSPASHRVRGPGARLGPEWVDGDGNRRIPRGGNARGRATQVG